MFAEVAQLVEHLTENQGVPSSNLGLGTIKLAEVVQWLERLLAKEEVASSNLVFRSISGQKEKGLSSPFFVAS